MNIEIQNIVQTILDRIHENDLLDFLYTQCERLSSIDTAGDSIVPLLQIMENYPQIDFGMPGPIVHFVEKFFRHGYEGKLVDSIERKPTNHTLWMLNRIINGVKGETKEQLVKVLGEVVERDDIDNETRNTAQEFLDLHE